MRSKFAFTAGALLGFGAAAIPAGNRAWSQVAEADAAIKAEEAARKEADARREAERAAAIDAGARDKYKTVDLSVKSEATLAIERALAMRISVDFMETRLADAIEFVREKTNVNILIDDRGLDTASVTRDTPMSLKLKEVTVKTVLNFLLDPLELTALIRDEVLVVTDKQDTGNRLVRRIYPVADLVLLGGDDEQRLAVEELIELLQSIVGPDTWEANGGTGDVSFHSPTMSLVVSQAECQHDSIADVFKGLRAARENLDAFADEFKLPDRSVLAALAQARLNAREERATGRENSRVVAEAVAEKAVGNDRAENPALLQIKLETAAAEKRMMEAQARRAEVEAQVAEWQLRQLQNPFEKK